MKKSTLIGLFAGLLTASTAMQATGEPLLLDRLLFRYNGFDFLESDLPAGLRQQLYALEDEHYRKQKRIIDEALLRLHLQEEAKRTEKTLEAVASEQLRVDDPDEDSIREFFEKNKESIPYPYEKAKERIAQLIRARRVEEKKIGLVNAAKAANDFELMLPKPVPPAVEIATEGFPTKGNAEAKVTIVEFADYQCPHCKFASSVMKRLMARYGESVKHVYMDFPVNRSGISRSVAWGAVCADEQGKFWEYHAFAFKRQNTLNHESPQAIAKALDLDEEAFNQCFESPKAKARVARSEREARRLGLNSTPTLFINGQRLQLTDMERDLENAIQRALKDTKS